MIRQVQEALGRQLTDDETAVVRRAVIRYVQQAETGSPTGLCRCGHEQAEHQGPTNHGACYHCEAVLDDAGEVEDYGDCVCERFTWVGWRLDIVDRVVLQVVAENKRRSLAEKLSACEDPFA